MPFTLPIYILPSQPLTDRIHFLIYSYFSQENQFTSKTQWAIMNESSGVAQIIANIEIGGTKQTACGDQHECDISWMCRRQNQHSRNVNAN